MDLANPEEEASAEEITTTNERHNPIASERMDAMNSHVSSILLGVNDMERSKRFYTEGLGWEVQDDYRVSVFFVPHGGSLVGFYGRDGLADMVGVSPEGAASVAWSSITLCGARTASTKFWRRPRGRAGRFSHPRRS